MLFRESETVELKETYINELRKEIIAFANTNGGIIYIGVSDDGTAVGLENTDFVIQQISNVCRDAIKPDITMFLNYEIIDIEDKQENKQIVAVHIQRGTARPYYIAAKGLKPAGVFVRQGTSSVPASESAIRQMIKETDGDCFENMRSLKQELTFIEVTRFFEQSGLEFEAIHMKTLGLINSEGIYTNLALLLSDQCPHIIKAASFHGDTQEDFQDRREFSGSLLKQLNDAYDYLDMNNRLSATFNGLLRIDVRDYSEAAVREALLNAIVHRDYSYSASTLISIYANRMEFVSIGGLPGGITLEDVLFGLSVCRNPKLANIFYRLNLIEAYGTGLKKIMNAYTDNINQPQFLVSPNVFKVILPNMNQQNNDNDNDTRQNINLDIHTSHISHKSIGESEVRTAQLKDRVADEQEIIVLQLLEQNTEISRMDVENVLGIKAASALRLLKKMKDNESIQTIGKGKNTRYIKSGD